MFFPGLLKFTISQIMSTRFCISATVTILSISFKSLPLVLVFCLIICTSSRALSTFLSKLGSFSMPMSTSYLIIALLLFTALITRTVSDTKNNSVYLLSIGSRALNIPVSPSLYPIYPKHSTFLLFPLSSALNIAYAFYISFSGSVYFFFANLSNRVSILFAYHSMYSGLNAIFLILVHQQMLYSHLHKSVDVLDY